MRAGKLDISEFVICKELHSYEPKTRSPHVTMCQRIKAVSPAEAPVLGTKVSYVLRRGGEDISDRAYPPEEVQSVDIDYDYYFEKQVLNPLTEILAPLCGGKAKLMRLLQNEHARQHEITALFERKSPSPDGGGGPPQTEAAAGRSNKKRPAVKSKAIQGFFTPVEKTPPAKRIKKEAGKRSTASQSSITVFFQDKTKPPQIKMK